MSHVVLLLTLCHVTGGPAIATRTAQLTRPVAAAATGPSAERQLGADPAVGQEKAAQGDAAKPAPAPGGIEWFTHYDEALRTAKAQGRMMFVWFQDAAHPANDARFEAVSLRDPKIRRLLDRFVTVKLSTDERITVDGKESRLIDHPAFQELHRRPGVAIIDYAHRGTDYYGYVVNCVPFTPGKYYRYRPEHLSVVLDLPPGTITQRTLMFAVRIHPERPASTQGQVDPHLMQEARNHSAYQAQIRVQGHHRWAERFPRLSRVLGFGLRAQEVVAESWPHENLVDAAVDCVDSWRHSSGHWQAVRSPQPKFAYDMKRGSNGIWYATGLFGNYQ